MKKTIFALFIFVHAFQIVSASHVDKEKARLVAGNVYYEHIRTQQAVYYNSVIPVHVFTQNDQSGDLYFVFNINLGGFVIISADDAVWPVLGFSFEGSYGSEEKPAAFARWMDDYSSQIRIVKEQLLQPAAAVKAEWQRLSAQGPLPAKGIKSLVPLLYTKWDQGKYYNELCPLASGGPDGRAWAGCVPTAMAQIMNYWRWPVQGTGAYSYVDSTYGTLSADFGNTLYRWDEMPVSLSTYNSALAQLLYHLGVSCDLKYGPGGSGMYNHKAAYSLRTYFGYSPATEYVFRDTCTLNWKNLVLTHLDNKIPLYYAGWADTINVSGHAFVCDGYQDTTYFHMNWGWSGSYNGYFMLDNLTPGGNNFTLDHELIVNIFPAGSYPQYCSGTDTLVVNSSTIDDGSGPVNDYANNSDCYWLIAPDDSVVNIKLRFIKFDLAAGDTLFVYNGDEVTDPVLAKLSGSNLPTVITGNKPNMLLHFVSDNTITAGGFLLKDSTTVPVYCTGTTVLSTQSGAVEDGSGAQNYHNNSTCYWTVQPAGATAITIHFNDLHLTTGDFINIIDLQNGQTIKHITGDTLPPDIVCPSGKLRIFFRADGKYTAQGWSLNYYNSSGVEEYNELSDLELMPNPASEEIFLKGMLVRGQALKVEVLNASLMKIMEEQFDSDAGNLELKIETGELKPGIYILRVSGEKNIITRKIIII